jgi:hypothetical protein
MSSFSSLGTSGAAFDAEHAAGQALAAEEIAEIVRR